MVDLNQFNQGHFRTPFWFNLSQLRQSLHIELNPHGATASPKHHASFFSLNLNPPLLKNESQSSRDRKRRNDNFEELIIVNFLFTCY